MTLDEVEVTVPSPDYTEAEREWAEIHIRHPNEVARTFHVGSSRLVSVRLQTPGTNGTEHFMRDLCCLPWFDDEEWD